MLKRLNLVVIAVLLASPSVLAQTYPPDIQSLISAENYFAGLSVGKGVKKAFLRVSDKNTIVFRPGPVSAKEFYSKAEEDSTYLYWYPSFARIAKSGDWGFTSGPFVVKPSAQSAKEGYGQYCSVWKRNAKGVWKLAIDIGITHSKPGSEPKLDFASPDEEKFFKQRSPNRLQQREDIVKSTDDLFGTSLRVVGNKAYDEYGSDDIHFLFPGSQPVIGTQKVQEFLNKERIKINTTHTAGDRAYSGELAYTYGTAHATQKGLIRIYNYVRIWELQEGKWNVLFEVYAPDPSASLKEEYTEGNK
ncbi:MAG TPA: hypothetical protein VGE26_04045 [Sphingobacteriaceae bacterium]